MSILDTVTSTLSPTGTTPVTPPAPSEWGKENGHDNGWGHDAHHGEGHGDWGKEAGHHKGNDDWGNEPGKGHDKGDCKEADSSHGNGPGHGDWGHGHHAEHGSGDKYSDACFGGGEKGPDCHPSTAHHESPCGYDFSLDKGCGTVSASHDGLMSGLA
ncbi:hypothetical protein [Methylobacterium sp. J-090]|uniref:hypothetical protein n=1 Tax=Methylobacterium sp. J-090 TaxID=2836666 RepID=UPI001FB86967|nr:hypothetical protein [Methylobacterium sp. J-090]MCJ2080668.1 hypothetical protein [Methylobacterium sp. J-090]